MKNEIEVIEVKGQAPSVLIEMAVAKGTDLEKLEKLLSLQERWEANEARKAYNKAMSEFKANPPEIDKDKKVSFATSVGKTQYSHASLYNVTEKINSALSKHGLSASWTTKQNGAICVTCRITHVKGHSEETMLLAQADSSGSKNAIQAIGSTITYLERYTLLALTGLATFDQDDDGQAAAAPAVEFIDDKQKNQLLDLIAEKCVSTEKFCLAFKIKELAELPKARYQEAINAINAKKAKVVK